MIKETTDMCSNPVVKHGKHKKRSESKVLLLLIMLELEGPIGRYRLKEMLDLSEQEGLVRLMLADLKRESLAKTSKAGCELTRKGKRFLKETLKKHGIVEIKEIFLELLGKGSESFTFQCRGSSMPASITDLRDVAVRYGSSGAILILYDQGILKVPEVYTDLRDKHQGIANNICKALNLSDGDIILTTFSGNKWRALEGGLSMAIRLAEGLH